MTRSAGRPLSTTLVLALVALVVLVTAGVGVATVALTRDQLERGVDAQLLEQAQNVPRPGPPGDQGGTPPPVREACDPFRPGLGEGTVQACSDDASGTGFLVTGGSSETLAESTVRLLLDTAGEDPATVQVPGLGAYRVVATGTANAGDGDVVVTGLPLSGVESTVADLIRTVLLVGLAGAVVTALGGAWVVRRALRPLAQVAATARQVSALDLHSGDVALDVRVDPDLLRPGTEAGQVATALDSLLDDVGGALQARHRSETRLRTFVADASHELRTPLASIRGYAELSRAHAADLPDVVRTGVQRIESEATRMTGLVDDLLLLAKLDAGRRLEQEEVDLSLLVLESVSDARVTGREHEWRLDLPPEPVTLVGDAPRLRQVLTNLLANARAHTPAGTRVTTTVRSEGDVVALRVTDDGPGIAPERQGEVFERFSRGDAGRARAEGSTGLGLSIVRAVVRAHGGEVTVTSEPGATVFEVLLPQSGAAGAATG